MHLQQVFEPAHDLARLRGGRGHVELVLGDARRGAVIQHDAVVVQHHAIAHLADGQLGEAVDIDAVQELRRVRTLDVDLAECGHIGEAHAAAHELHFLHIGRLGRIAGPGVIPGALPQSGVDEGGAVLLVPVVERRAAHRAEVRAHRAACNRAHSERRVRRAESGGARVRNGDAAIFGHQGQRIDVGGLALVGAHAERGVALQVLDRAIAFLMRDLDVLDGDVALEINEGLALGSLRRRPGREDCVGPIRRVFRRIDGARLAEAGIGRSRGSGVGAVCDCSGETECAHHRASSEMRGGEAARHEASDRFVILRLDAAVGREMHHRRPAAGHAHGIAFDGDGMHAAQRHALDTLGAIDIENATAREDGDALRTGAGENIGGNIGAVVRHRHGDARGSKIECRLIGGVVVGDDHRALVGRHREAIDIGAERRSEHHARTVVVGEDQRPLDGASGHDDGPGAQLRQHHARLARGRIGVQVAAVLHQHGEIAVIEALHGGAGEGLDIGEALQFVDAGEAPGLLLGIIAGEQRAAEITVLLGQHDTRAAAACGECRGEARRAGADHQHVAEGEALVITVRVGKFGRLAQARRLADEGLVEHPGALRRAHEGLVIEARLEQGRQQRIDSHQVEVG